MGSRKLIDLPEYAGLKKERIPYNTIEEALEIANVKIFTNNTLLYYIANIPLTELETCKKLLVKPIKRNNKIIK